MRKLLLLVVSLFFIPFSFAASSAFYGQGSEGIKVTILYDNNAFALGTQPDWG